MTPLEIEILMHYRCGGGDYRNGDFSAPAVGEAIDRFVQKGILLANMGAGSAYVGDMAQLTVYVDALCAVPLPVLKWTIPEQAVKQE